jgi:hypothetical protein
MKHYTSLDFHGKQFDCIFRLIRPVIPVQNGH